jgi:hypothetical protein
MLLRMLRSGCVMLMCFNALPVSAEYPVAGINPSQRPHGAPVIEWVRHDKGWFVQALTGVQKPYPKSLYFLDNQGYWYTPFNRPGMLGKYDIRGWHKK